MTFWRAVGMNYVQYSSICARAVRQALKPEFQNEAVKRDGFNIQMMRWKDGKQEGKQVSKG